MMSKCVTITSLLVLTILGNTGLAVEEYVLALELPEAYDLRADGCVTSVKEQRGGTCWTHGTMAAIESNLLVTGMWSALGLTDPPNLAEYHLDWWNGFNRRHNGDLLPSRGDGLTVHQGGDYLVATAYLTRGDGVVYDPRANDDTELDDAWFEQPPHRKDTDYLLFYARDVEWYSAGEDLSNIDTIKEALMTHGAIATCIYAGDAAAHYNAQYDSGYQPPYDSRPPNHSVAIIGWDDNKVTQAPQKGAWLIKNSWGTGTGAGSDYVWGSYFDKHCAKAPEMGAVSFQQVEPLAYDRIYYHDYHGWRDTKTDCVAAFNAFVAGGNERIKAVSFFTASDDVTYTAKIFAGFADGQLENELSVRTGHIAHTGFHTVDLEPSVPVAAGDDFYVYLELSNGGHAYDCTSYVKLLLTDPQADTRSEPSFVEALDVQATQQFSFRNAYAYAKMAAEDGEGTLVPSTSEPNQSYYLDDGVWVDLYDFDNTANFCIKALTTDVTADINQDGIVDQEDVTLLETALGSEIGTSSWNPDCDLNLDNAVDEEDYESLMEQWSREFPRKEWPIAHWGLDEKDGQYVKDSAENRDALLAGDPVWQPDAGMVGGALQLDGIDDCVETTLNLNPGESPFSVFAWVKGGAPDEVIVSQLGGAKWLMIEDDGVLATGLSSHGTRKVLASETPITGGNWHRVGLTWDGSVSTLYVDDIKVAEDTQPALENRDAVLYLGACGPGNRGRAATFFAGLIDDVRVYNRAIVP